MSVNWFGCATLFKKEVWRFLKVYHQTLFSPVINILLFLAVFSLSVGEHIKNIADVSFVLFMSSGLIIMSAMQNSFENSSSSLVMSKVMGNIIDYLIPPFSAFELLFAMTLAALVRGLMVGLIAYIAISFFIDWTIYSPLYAIMMIILACLLLSLVGMLCGVCSENFDQRQAISSYFITPLTFLSGTFYSINSLPEFWRQIAYFNPFFYMIDGFRYGITGHNDGNLLFGAIYIIMINIILAGVVYFLIKKGYKIKS
jgi:ABC-2 type transport system permease protein